MVQIAGIQSTADYYPQETAEIVHGPKFIDLYTVLM